MPSDKERLDWLEQHRTPGGKWRWTDTGELRSDRPCWSLRKAALYPTAREAIDAAMEAEKKED